MSNVTLSVDTEVLQAAMRYAAEHDTSVNQLVREFLTDIAGREDRVREARRKILELTEKTKGRMGKKTWSRDSLYG